MAYRGSWEERNLVLSLKPGSLTLSITHPVGVDVLSHDLEGRLWSAVLEGVTYRRGLNGKIVAKWRPPGGDRQRRWLCDQEADAIVARAHRRVRRVHAALLTGRATLNHPLPARGWAALERALSFDVDGARRDAARFRSIFQPVGILPPDQYMAVVLQATEGCPFNTCTFCNFYTDVQFRIKARETFEAHARAVREYLGAGLSLRKSVFLGAANALMIPSPRLSSLFEVIHDVFDLTRLDGVYAFVDGFSGEKKTEADYADLAQKGLRRVYIGMESGDADLSRFVQKPGNPQDAVQAVRAMKAGGVAVGIIILLGIGGHTYAKSHVRETARALNAMPLDDQDLIYFSELVTSEGLPYLEAAYRAQLDPLAPDELVRQRSAIERKLRFATPSRAPQVSRYDIREFIY